MKCYTITTQVENIQYKEREEVQKTYIKLEGHRHF